MSKNIPITEQEVAEVEAYQQLYQEISMMYDDKRIVEQILKYRYTVGKTLKKYLDTIEDLHTEKSEV